jgi:hypothetical protein
LHEWDILYFSVIPVSVPQNIVTHNQLQDDPGSGSFALRLTGAIVTGRLHPATDRLASPTTSDSCRDSVSAVLPGTVRSRAVFADLSTKDSQSFMIEATVSGARPEGKGNTPAHSNRQRNRPIKIPFPARYGGCKAISVSVLLWR